MEMIITMKSGILNTKTQNELYDALMKIKCDTRYSIATTIFEVNKSYEFTGHTGTVKVTFTDSDFE